MAWEPVAAAQDYEVQWSHTLNPWRTQPGSLLIGATSAVLPVYRRSHRDAFGEPTPKLAPVIRLLVALGINALALWVANALWDGLRIHGFWAYVIGAAVLGVANGIIKPIVAILTLPLIILTLGLFLLVINIGMVALAAWITPHFAIHGFWTYVGTVVIVWLVNWIAQRVLDEGERRPALSRI